MARRNLICSNRSRIYHDAEVRAFLDALLNDPLTMDEMRTRIRERFGIDRTPGRSAIGRYVRSARLARGIDFLRIK